MKDRFDEVLIIPLAAHVSQRIGYMLADILVKTTVRETHIISKDNVFFKSDSIGRDKHI